MKYLSHEKVEKEMEKNDKKINATVTVEVTKQYKEVSFRLYVFIIHTSYTHHTHIIHIHIHTLKHKIRT